MPQERRIKGTAYYFLIVLSYHFSAVAKHYGLLPENDFDYGLFHVSGSQLKTSRTGLHFLFPRQSKDFLWNTQSLEVLNGRILHCKC